MKTRIPELDIIRGISIYLVVLGHLVDLIGDPAPAINLCHIAAFFFVSGFLLYGSLERHGMTALLRAKTRGLLIPYLCWSAVSLAANIAFSLIRGEALSRQAFMAEFINIFLRGRSVWFLIQLLFAHWVFLACRQLAGRGKRLWILNLAAYILLYLILPDGWFQFILFKRLYIFFLAGYAFAAMPTLGKVCKKPPVNRMLVAVACTYPVLVWAFYRSGLYAQMIESTRNPIAVILGMLAGAVGVLLIWFLAGLLSNRGSGNALSIIGQYSIDVYVMHMFLVKFLPVQGLTGGLPVYLTYVLLMAYAAMIVIGIYFLAAYVLRRIKLYRISVGR